MFKKGYVCLRNVTIIFKIRHLSIQLIFCVQIYLNYTHKNLLFSVYSRKILHLNYNSIILIACIYFTFCNLIKIYNFFKI
jgi:hypothetical protein